MTGSVSLIGNGVSVIGGVSLDAVTTALFANGVQLLCGVSLTGSGTASPSPPATSIYSYNFSLPKNSFYITTTAF